ncbi:histidine kinase [Sphingomonas antarctica]
MSVADKDAMSGSLWVGENSETAKGTHRGAAEALRESSARFDVLLDLMPQMVWSTLPGGFHDYYNRRWYEFTGVPEGSTDGEAWNGMFHPDDQERAWDRWRHCLATGEPYEIEYRLRHRSGDYRWVLGRASPVRDDAGQISRWIGTCTDIHDAKLDAEQNVILSRELSHRIKNIFAVVNGLIGQSARSYPEAKPFAVLLQQRVAALGQAHEFVRPHSEESRPDVPEASVQTLLARLFSAYPAFAEGRFTLSGEDTPIDDRGATPIALVFHELATNAAKYGALSAADGRVAVNVVRNGEDLVIDWLEDGGPRVDGPPQGRGFGSRLVEMSIGGQLGGAIDEDWRPEGLHARVTVAASRLIR